MLIITYCISYLVYLTAATRSTDAGCSSSMYDDSWSRDGDGDSSNRDGDGDSSNSRNAGSTAGSRAAP